MAQPNHPSGVQFPLVDGSRSSTATGVAVFADAARAIDPGLAGRIEAEQSWRTDYVRHVRALVETELAVDDPAAVPRAGLDSLHRRFVVVRDGVDVPLREAITAPRHDLAMAEVHGEGTPPDGFSVPYRGELLEGDSLRRQLDRWVEGDIVEPSFAEAIGSVIANPDWLDLSDTTVAVLGAGAEMGPLPSLARWHANVVAVDLPRPELWTRIIRTLRAGNSRAWVPVRGSHSRDLDDHALAERAGVDLTEETAETAAWLATFDGPLVLGNYVYADGANNVQVAMAVDAVTGCLLDERDDLSLAVLLTPTDAYPVPEEVVAAAQRRYLDVGATARLTCRLSGGRVFAPNYEETIEAHDGAKFGIADSMITQQGPNYLLSKRLQRWRARLARADGVTSSANLAPATRTRSVTKNRILAAAYDGAPRFGIEVFEPDTSNSLMAAMLVHDIRNSKSSAQPDTPLPHPTALFADAAAHGGMWRNPYNPRTALPVAAVLGLLPGR